MTVGRLTVVCGPMWSGKTTALQRHADRAHRAKRPFVVIRPGCDTRTDHWANHMGTIGPGKPLVHDTESCKRPRVPPGTRLVVIDEGQFFGENDLWRWCEHWTLLGIDVVVGGLDMDAWGVPFEAIAKVAACASVVEKVTAICARCGADATRTKAISGDVEEPCDDGTSRIRLGGPESYEARCRSCWVL